MPVRQTLKARIPIDVPAHNFALVKSQGRLHLFGGRARSPHTGVMAFAGDGAVPLAFRYGGVRVNGTHPGCMELRRTPRVCEWDGKLSAAALPAGGVALFGTGGGTRPGRGRADAAGRSL